MKKTHLNTDLQDAMYQYERKLKKENAVTLTLPQGFAFKDHDVFVFDNLLSFFRWDLHDQQVKIDLSECTAANYQAVALLIPYIWHLVSKNCHVSVIESEDGEGASSMWRMIGGRGAIPVLKSKTQKLKGSDLKPTIAVRDGDDFKEVIQTSEEFTKGFNIEYEKTLRYILSELLYNTMEHGYAHYNHKGHDCQFPSLAQFTYYKGRNELQFIIADLGIGIKKHIEQAYPGQESDEAAIKLAIRPQVSGTFASTDPYKDKNNAGVGLFISSNIIRRLNASMHIVSGNGLLHVSPRDITGKTLNNRWPGTFVLVTISLGSDPTLQLHNLMQEFRTAAYSEQRKAELKEEDNRFYLNIKNEFGSFAEYKPAAIRCRDNKIFPAANSHKEIVIDFDGVSSAPHSFLSALLASPIKTLGMSAYKRMKFVNTPPEIRETIDFILDENTE